MDISQLLVDILKLELIINCAERTVLVTIHVELLNELSEDGRGI